MKFFGLCEVKPTWDNFFKDATNQDLLNLMSEIKSELVRRRNKAVSSVLVPIKDRKEIDLYNKNLAELDDLLSKLNNVEVPVAGSHEN